MSYRDPRPSAPRMLAVLDHFEDHDRPVPGVSGSYLRSRGLAAALRGVLPTDVLSIRSVRRSVSCETQCGSCASTQLQLGTETVRAPYRWGYCARAAARLTHQADRYQAVLMSGIQLYPYLPMVRALCQGPLIIDLHNAETDLYRTMAGHPEWPAGPTDERDLRAIAHVERRLVDAADAITVPSTMDETALRRRHGTSIPVLVLPNAVHVDPASRPATPRQPARCVFVGDFRHFPNTLAAHDIARLVGPAIHRRCPALPVVIAGRQPPPHLVSAVHTGPVRLVPDPPDIHPLLDNAILIVPLTLGGGTRLKILEAFAAGTSVIATGKGIEGIRATPGSHYLPAESPTEFAAGVARVLDDPVRDLRRRQQAWELVNDRYSWTGLVEPARTVLTTVGVPCPA